MVKADGMTEALRCCLSEVGETARSAGPLPAALRVSDLRPEMRRCALRSASMAESGLTVVWGANDRDRLFKERWLVVVAGMDDWGAVVAAVEERVGVRSKSSVSTADVSVAVEGMVK